MTPISAVDPVSGLVVAFSGVQQHYDELISQWMLSTLAALSIDRMVDVMDSDLSVFDEDDGDEPWPEMDDPSGLIQLQDMHGIVLAR